MVTSGYLVALAARCDESNPGELRGLAANCGAALAECAGLLERRHKLVEAWRKRARGDDEVGEWESARVWSTCADELEAIIGGESK